MAVQVDFDFKGVMIPAAYLVLTDIGGGKVRGGWLGVVSVFANKELSKPRQRLIKEAVPAVPEVPATEENLAVPGISEIPAEYETVAPDPICQFQVAAPYDLEMLNPYVLLYSALMDQLPGSEAV